MLYRYGDFRPTSIEQLGNKNITVLANSSHAENLRLLKQSNPVIQWQESSEAEILDLLEQLDSGEIDYTIIDSNEYDTHKAYFAKLGVAMTISEPQQLAWFTKQHSPLESALGDFFGQIKEDGSLKKLHDKHYGHSTYVSRIGSRTFAANVKTVFPKYQSLIKKVALQENIDWLLLAAISYQESHWNPKAKSPTGVRGMMMLTQVTAKEVGVKNRIDAEQSLVGGARYFLKTKKRLAKDILEPDRTWFTLAAYNVGMGHLEDARIITEREGGDPHLWLDVMQRLPLLRKHAYYSKTKYGYARGNEPVDYVQRIRHYYNILKWKEVAKSRIPPPAQVVKFVPKKMSTPGRLAAL